MRYVLAVDQGTTSTRAVIFDHCARIIATDQREHDQIFLAPGWVEHDALQILARTESVIVGAMSAAGIGTDQLAAVGITNQRETSLLWDRRTGKPLANAIVWQDTRTLDICSNLAGRLGQNGLRAKTGLPISTYFSAPKIRWLFDHLPEATERCRRGDWLFGTIDSWLVWNLTGEHVTDVTNASRTLLMNLDTLDWDEELLEVFQLPRQMLPRIVPSSQTIALGRGLLEGVPVAAILGDQQAALFGQVCFDPGAVKCTYGTGGFLLLNCGTTPKSSSHGLITTVAYQLGNDQAHYALEGSVAIAGAAVQWLRDGLGIIRTSADIEELARSVPDNGGVYFVPAFNGLYAPYWREDARGAIFGLTRYANRGHLARATLEATAYQTQEVLEAMKQDSNLDFCVLRADGGMVQNRLLMQFQADISRVRVEIPGVTETTALGAAYAAGLATGYWKDLNELSANWSTATHYEPQVPEEDRTVLLEKWHKAIDCSLGWV